MQIKSAVWVAVGEGQSNLVEEIPQDFLSVMNPRQVSLTWSFSCLTAENIKNAAKPTI